MNNNKVGGKIIKVSPEGWGFIISRDIEFTRIFFHWTALEQSTLSFKEIRSGMKCEFVPVQIPGRGWRAIKIRILEKEMKDEMPILSE
jgi:cold shock CspA family protein